MKLGETGVIVALMVALAGCIGGGSSNPEETQQSTMAPEPTATEGFGSITGLVLNVEQLPIEGAEVVVVGSSNQTLTDSSGRFTFNGLAPDRYSVAAQKLGYKQGSQTVDVTAGEVSEVQLTLEPFEVPKDPVVDTQIYDGFIQCAVNPLYPVQPCGALGEDKAYFTVTIGDEYEFFDLILDLQWTPTTEATGKDLEMDVCKRQDSPDPFVCAFVSEGDWTSYESGPSPLQLRLPASEMPLDETREYEIWVTGGFTEPTPTFQQPFTLYVTTCHVAQCAESFTGIPSGS